MKLGTRFNGTRDGELVVFSRDCSKLVSAKDVAPSLQYAIDHWEECSPQLQSLSQSLFSGNVLGVEVDCEQLLAPLPRAYEWIDGSAYVRHIELVRKARGVPLPPTLRIDPLVYQGGSGTMLPPNSSIRVIDEKWGYDFESELCVVVSDTPQGVNLEEAAKHVILIGLVNDISLRGLIPSELEKGFGFVQSKPSTVFGPAFVTPDELGLNWEDGRVHMHIRTELNDKIVGFMNAGPEMHFSFHELIAHITKTRSLTAGTIIGSGTVASADISDGSSCLAEVRMLEVIESGEAKTSFLRPGDELLIEVQDEDGFTLFGKIRQLVVS